MKLRSKSIDNADFSNRKNSIIDARSGRLYEMSGLVGLHKRAVFQGRNDCKVEKSAFHSGDNRPVIAE